MTLRRRGYLIEATYRRDKEYRDEAHGFFKDLLAFVKRHPERLELRNDGTFFLRSNEFWDHWLADYLVIFFAPKKRGVMGGVGQKGRTEVLVLYVLNAPGDKRNLHINLEFKSSFIVHELIHIITPRNISAKTDHDFSAGELDKKSYYNDSSEWNAYWQEGAFAWERLFDHQMRKRKMWVKMFFGDGSLSQCRARVGKIWDDGFLENMDKKTERKFDKRFARLWKTWRVKIRSLVLNGV